MKRLFDWINHHLMRLFAIRIEVPRDRRYQLAHKGTGGGFGRRVELQAPEGIAIGNNVTINNDCYLAGDGGITIGDDVLIGPGVYLFSVSHEIANPDVPVRLQGRPTAPIRVEDDVWIGAHSTVVAGVTIGRGAVVGANSVVTRDVEPLAIVAGVPARQIGRRGS